MDEIKIIEVKQSVFEDNNQDADRLRTQLKEEKTGEGIPALADWIINSVKEWNK